MLSPTGIRLAIMMFLQFFIWGAWYVTVGPYLVSIGFSGGARGWTYSVGPISAIISPLFVGMIADRFFNSERVMGFLHLAGGGIMIFAAVLMKQEASPFAINLAFFGHTLCYYPTLALSNSIALQNMVDSKKEFPVIRVFGTFGWIAAGFAVSQFGWDGVKDGDVFTTLPSINMFYLAAGAAIVLGVYSFTLPATPPSLKGSKVAARELLGLDALVLMKRRSFAVFMISSFLICIPLAFYYQLTAVFVTASGFQNTGQTMTYGQMSEIVFMIAMPFFFARLGVKWMLGVGMLCWVARYALFAAYDPASDMKWMILLGILLHGICYDFFFVTGQIYTDDVAPRSIRSQAQGLLVLFTQGLGMLIGAQIAGKLEEKYTYSTGLNAKGKETFAISWDELWWYPCVMSLAILVLFVLLFKDDHVPDSIAEDDATPAPATDAPPA